MPTANSQEDSTSTNHEQSGQPSMVTPGGGNQSSQARNSTSTDSQEPADGPINLDDYMTETFVPTEEEKRLWQRGSNNSDSK